MLLNNHFKKSKNTSGIKSISHVTLDLRKAEVRPIKEAKTNFHKMSTNIKTITNGYFKTNYHNFKKLLNMIYDDVQI